MIFLLHVHRIAPLRGQHGFLWFFPVRKGRLFLFLLLSGLFLFTGCNHAPSGGSVRAQVTQHADRSVSRMVEYTAPANAREGSSLSLRLPAGTFGAGDIWADALPLALNKENADPALIALEASFGGGFEPPAPEPQGRVDGQRILYGGAVACVLMGLGLGYFGMHLKLMVISFAAGSGLALLAMFIDRFAVQTALFVGCGVVAAAALIGWLFWRDYKSRLNPFLPTPQSSSAA